jgi:hypothetical protein
MSDTISPLAPKSVPVMPPVAGVRLATAAAGIRYQGRTDVMLAVFDEGASVAGVFTRSKCPSAPVEWCRARVKNGRARVLVVNSGNANAFTGKNGRDACGFTAKLAAAGMLGRREMPTGQERNRLGSPQRVANLQRGHNPRVRQRVAMRRWPEIDRRRLARPRKARA